MFGLPVVGIGGGATQDSSEMPDVIWSTVDVDVVAVAIAMPLLDPPPEPDAASSS
jgi:hypothetical protein